MYDTTLPCFTLGVAQEPIPAGGMGRVCVRGLTVALIWDIEKGQIVAQEYPSRDYAMVEKHVGTAGGSFAGRRMGTARWWVSSAATCGSRNTTRTEPTTIA